MELKNYPTSYKPSPEKLAKALQYLLPSIKRIALEDQEKKKSEQGA